MFKHKEMNEQSEHFRKITMKVLTMQLNSITIMDLIAYGGAALGVILAVTQFQNGKATCSDALMIILLAADFSCQCGFWDHFSILQKNGMAASDKIFRLLDLPEPDQKRRLSRMTVRSNVGISGFPMKQAGEIPFTVSI